MPIYDYQCTSCGYELEVIQKISEAPLTDCPECSKPSLKKKVSAPSFRLSGQGWYETDFKDSNQKNLASKDDGKPNSITKKETKKNTSQGTTKATAKSASTASSCSSGSCGSH